MADLIVLLVAGVMSLQVVIFGGFLLLAAMDPQKDARPSTYQPMEILTARAKGMRNQSVE